MSTPPAARCTLGSVAPLPSRGHGGREPAAGWGRPASGEAGIAAQQSRGKSLSTQGSTARTPPPSRASGLTWGHVTWTSSHYTPSHTADQDARPHPLTRGSLRRAIAAPGAGTRVPRCPVPPLSSMGKAQAEVETGSWVPGPPWLPDGQVEVPRGQSKRTRWKVQVPASSEAPQGPHSQQKPTEGGAGKGRCGPLDVMCRGQREMFSPQEFTSDPNSDTQSDDTVTAAGVTLARPTSPPQPARGLPRGVHHGEETPTGPALPGHTQASAPRLFPGQYSTARLLWGPRPPSGHLRCTGGSVGATRKHTCHPGMGRLWSWGPGPSPAGTRAD